MCFLIIDTLSISIILVEAAWEELSLIESNQQICGFYKSPLEKKRNSIKYIFDISKLFIQCNTDSCCEHITSGVNIYLYGCVSLLAPVCTVCTVCVCVCVCVCARYQIRVLAKKSHHMLGLSTKKEGR